MISHIIFILLKILILSHFVKCIDPNCQIISPKDGSCILCNLNFSLDKSQGLCISDCDKNFFLEADSQQCVPSCNYNEYGNSDLGVCQKIYECPTLIDLGQDFHSGLASQIIVDDINQIIISISNTDTNIKLWNQVNGILKMTFSGHTQPVLKIYLLQDSNQLLSFSSKGEILYWNYSTGELNQSYILNLGQLTFLSCVNLNYGLITLYGYQGEFYVYNLQTKASKKYVGHSNIVLNSIIISSTSFITYSLDKSVILWNESTSTYSFQIICIHDSAPNGFILLNFSSNVGLESYLFSFGSSGSDSLNLSISNLQSTSIQCQQYLKGDFTQPILNVLGDSSSKSIIVYSSVEVVIYGFNSVTSNFILLQKINEQFFNQQLFLPLQGLTIFGNSIFLYTKYGKFSLTSYINNKNTIQSQQLIQTLSFIPIQINMQNIQGAIINQQKDHLYIFGQSIQQIDLISQRVNYIITNLPIPYIRPTQSVPQTVYNNTQNVLVSTSNDGLSLSYDFLTGELLSIFQHPDYKGSLIQPQGQTLSLVQGVIVCVAYSDLSFICYHAINMILYFKQIFFQPILRLFNDDVNGYVLINSLDYLQIIDPFNSKIIKTINKTGQFYYILLGANIICVTVSQDGYIIKYNYPQLTIQQQADSSNINQKKQTVVGFVFDNESQYTLFYFLNGLAIYYDEQYNVVLYSDDNILISRCGIVQDGQVQLYYTCLCKDGTVIYHGIINQEFYLKIQALSFPILYADEIVQYNKALFNVDFGSYGGSLILADSLAFLAQSKFDSQSKINSFTIDVQNQRVFICNTVGDIMASHFTPNTYYYLQRSENSILQKLLLIQSLQKLVSLSNVITIYDYFSQTIYKLNDRVHKQSIINALIIESIQIIISYNYDVSDNLQIWNFNTDQSQSLVGHQKGINGVQFIEQQNIIISYDKAGQIIVWNYNSDLLKIKIYQRISQNYNNEILNLFLFTKYQNLFISLDIVGNVFMSNFLDGSIVKAIKVSNMSAMIIDELYDRIILYGRSIEVYSATTGVKMQEIIGFDNQVQQIIFKNNYIIAYGTLVIQSIDRLTLAVLYTSQFKKNIYSLTVLNNFVGMVGNNIDFSIEVWDYTTGVMLSEIKNKSYPQNLVSIFSDEQSQLFIVQNVERFLFTVTPYSNSIVQQKDLLFAKMTSSYIKSYIFDFYSNILILCNDDTIIAWQYYAYVGFQGQAVMIPSESLIMSTYHSKLDVITYADLNQNLWQVNQNLLYYKYQLQYQPKQIVLHTNTYLVTDGINLYSYDLDFKLAYQLQIYPFSIYVDESITFIFVQTYSYQIVQLLLNTSNSQLTLVNVYKNHISRIVNCIINTIYSHIITFDVTGYLAINNYNTLKPITVPQQNQQIIRDIQIDFVFKRLITCSQDQSSILFSYSYDVPLKVLNVLIYSSSVIQAVIDTERLQVLIWIDLQLAIQVRDLDSTNLELIKYIYGPGDYKTQIKLTNKNIFSTNLTAQNNNNIMIYDISQTYLNEDQGYIQVVNDTVNFQQIVIKECQSVLGQALNKIQTSYFELSQSSFINNTCLNSYGCAYDISETKFSFTKCIFLYQQSQYGGAISVRNSPFKSMIQESNFQFNAASQGGSIYLQESNLELISTIITQNVAEVGGAIRYVGFVPDFITKKQYLSNNLSKNNIVKNQAKIFGQNIGSYPRQIEIERTDQEIDFNLIQQIQGETVYQIDNFMSGGNLNFKIKVYDEENNIVNLNSLEESSKELQSELQQYQLECISLNSQMMLINGNKAIYNSLDNSFTFQNIQLISTPETQSVFYIQNNIIQIPNPQNTTQFQLKPLYIKLNVNFRQCEMGEIIIKSTQNNPSYCEKCPIQKYSLVTPNINSQNEQLCKLCPDSCSYCQGKTLTLKNGYWRENNYTDVIVSCVNNPDNCLGQSAETIQYCKKGYIGPLCETCDFYGKIWQQKYMNKEKFECIPCQDSYSQLYTYLSSLLLKNDWVSKYRKQ
ncbi:transmembrane protein (macronuclear) [Tetrahymena thermophila SB210]|uniref:Transmembrane protein n=1 Tax=Tetrahymena thermophila (strain SB210) TaxID=312017 RepID=W7XB56_TETTS|nr:transmembrane protein [Tetrahymena thermophila SB210]EWS76615.1 transmembrane protein [Tetrahymena thermophila SB210]|eukprot:XP_012650901.1 transmembrane protein [Tetrahymena thermophila SB210]